MTPFAKKGRPAGISRTGAHLVPLHEYSRTVYVTGYMGDIGIPLDGSPMDFSGWFEVYLSGKWHTCDATSQ